MNIALPSFRSRVLPVVVITDARQAVPMAEALLAGGVDVMEITLRHSAAREISLRIERRTGDDNALLIRVEDDGGGDAARVAQSAGFGLTGIRERVNAAGGSLSILPARGGLSVAATIPLAA